MYSLLCGPDSSLREVPVRTRLFRSGNSMAVRIPKALGIEDWGAEVEIERQGDTVVLRPAARPLTGVLRLFAAFGPDFMAEGRPEGIEVDRAGWDAGSVRRRRPSR
jgi:antitoxin VapB